MKIYRAMCKEEFDKTLSSGRPDFLRRFKWFSPNIEWVYSRVKDGKFNNSQFKKDRYEYVCEFEWDGKCADFISTNEIQFDRRKNPKITFVKML